MVGCSSRYWWDDAVDIVGRSSYTIRIVPLGHLVTAAVCAYL